MDSDWLVVNSYTPSSPEALQVSVVTKQDEMGHLQPVLRANWTIKDDGGSSLLPDHYNCTSDVTATDY